MPITFATVVADAKEMVDETNSGFVPAGSWYRWLDQAIEEAWRILALRAPDSIETYVDFTATSVAVPANRGIRHLEKDPTQRVRQVVPFLRSVGRAGERGWYRQGETIFLQELTGSFRLTYLRAPKLWRTSVASPAEDDTIDTILEPFVEFLAVRLAIKAAQKDENQRPVLQARLKELADEMAIAVQLTSGQPTRIIETSDVDPLGHWSGGGRGSYYP